MRQLSALSPGELGSLIGDVQAGEPYYRDRGLRQAVNAYGKAELLNPACWRKPTSWANAAD